MFFRKFSRHIKICGKRQNITNRLNNFCVPLALSIGDISNVSDLKTRKELYGQIFENWETDYFSRVEQYFSEFNEHISKNNVFRIWYSNTPDEFCGLLHVLWTLRNKEVFVNIIRCSRTIKRNKQCAVTFSRSEELAAADIDSFLKFEESVSKEQKNEWGFLWERLVNENSPLRIMKNGNVVSTQVDYYDEVIWRHIPNEKFKTSNVISNILGRENLGISDFIIGIRIKDMVCQDKLRIVKKGESFYRDMLQRL